MGSVCYGVICLHTVPELFGFFVNQLVTFYPKPYNKFKVGWLEFCDLLIGSNLPVRLFSLAAVVCLFDDDTICTYKYILLWSWAKHKRIKINKEQLCCKMTLEPPQLFVCLLVFVFVKILSEWSQFEIGIFGFVFNTVTTVCHYCHFAGFFLFFVFCFPPSCDSVCFLANRKRKPKQTQKKSIATISVFAPHVNNNFRTQK